MKIPLTTPFFDESEEAAAARAIRSGWVTQGPCVEEFEKAISRYVGSKYAIATTSCTTSLFLALLANNIGPEDEVIVPSLSFIATSNPILYLGARPIFVDVDINTYNIDVSMVEGLITEKTKAIIGVHQFGLSLDIDPLIDICSRYNLALIQDSACAIGSEYKGKKIGGIGELNCFSFHPRKIITTGEGGMITTDNPEIDRLVRLLRSHGASTSAISRHKAKEVIIEEYSHLGYNFRMSDILAAVGLEQMKKLNKILERRRDLAKRYDKLLGDMEEVVVPYVPSYATHNYQTYCIRLMEKCKKGRDEIMAELLKTGISTRRGLMAIHLEPFYREKFGIVDLPLTELATKTTLALPLYPAMKEEMQDEVVMRLKDIIKIKKY